MTWLDEIAARVECQCDGCSACVPHVCRPEWSLVVFCQYCDRQRIDDAIAKAVTERDNARTQARVMKDTLDTLAGVVGVDPTRASGDELIAVVKERDEALDQLNYIESVCWWGGRRVTVRKLVEVAEEQAEEIARLREAVKATLNAAPVPHDPIWAPLHEALARVEAMGEGQG